MAQCFSDVSTGYTMNIACSLFPVFNIDAPVFISIEVCCNKVVCLPQEKRPKMTSQLQVNEKVDLSDSNIDTIEEVVRTVAASTNYLNLQSNQLSNLSPALSIFSKLTVLDLR